MAAYYFSQSPFFALKNIETKGNVQISEDEIIKKSGFIPGANYFDVDVNLARKRLLSIPLLEEVRIERKIPDGVVIDIKERTSVALFSIQGGFVIIDKKGYCLENCSSPKNYNLPVITGVKSDTLVPGKKVSGSKHLTEVLAILGEDADHFIAEINLADENSLIVYTRQGVPVLLGTTEKIVEKLDLARSHIELLSSVEGIEYVDVRSVLAPAVKCQMDNGGRGKVFSMLEN